jgi:hypothetical protein
MFDSWGRRAAVVAIVLLAAANVVFWGYIYHRQEVKPSAFATKQGPALLPLTATEPSPSAAPLSLSTNGSGVLRLSIVGDTLATGRYASGPTNRFRALALSALEARGPVAVQEATPTSASGPSTAVTVPGSLNLVILELGTDDMARTTATEFAADYGHLVDSIRASSPKAALVCAGTWSANGQAYDAVIQRDCVHADGRFVSLRALYADPANRGPAGVAGYYGLSDDRAPNDAGHRAIATALLRPLSVTLP